MRQLCSIPVIVLSLLLFVVSPRRLPIISLLPVVSPTYSSSSFVSPPIHLPPSCLAPPPLRPAPRSVPRLPFPPSPPPCLSPFLFLSRGFQPLHWSSLWLAFTPNRVVGVGVSHHSSLLSIPSSLGNALHQWVVPFVNGLCPLSTGCALRRWVVPFVVGLCPSLLRPGCGRRLAGPYSSLLDRRLSSGHRLSSSRCWSSDRRLSSGHRLPW